MKRHRPSTVTVVINGYRYTLTEAAAIYHNKGKAMIKGGTS